MKKCSVIVATYDRDIYLRNTLLAYTLQTNNNFQIIIINDGGSDSTQKVVEEFQEKLDIKYLSYSENKGRAYARNMGLNNSDTDIIIFSDDDRIPDQEFIDSYIKGLDGREDVVLIGHKYNVYTILNDVVPSMDILCKYIVSEKGELSTDGMHKGIVMFNEKEFIENFEKTIQKMLIKRSNDNYDSVAEKYGINLEKFKLGWALATTGNAAFARKNCKDILFDEDYNGWGMEDTDLFYRLSKKGFKFEVFPLAVNYHQNHEIESNQYIQLHKNIKIFCNKYPYFETYIFAQVFRRRKDYKNTFNLVDANELLLTLDKASDMDIIKKYCGFCCNNWLEDMSLL